MAQRHFSMSALQLNGTTFAGGQSFSYDPGLSVVSPTTDGASDEIFHSVQRSMPRIDFTTLELAALLNASFLAPTATPPFLALNGTTGARLVGRLQATDSNAHAAGSVHESLVIARGLVYLTGINAQVGSPAELSGRILGKSADGDTNPVALSQIAAPSEPNTIAPYILDSVSINGTVDDACTGVSLTIEAGERFEHGPNVFPTFVGIGQGSAVKYRLQITTDDESLHRSVGDIGAEQQVVVVIRNMTQGGTRGANTVTITTNNGLLVSTGRSQSGQGKGSITLEHHPRRNSGTAPITISVV